ncbi:MAG: hypothetical protein LAP13_09325 [Acidobacteriia bacterium]|nr:hypothetical protein [Terriglobia bacterium]
MRSKAEGILAAVKEGDIWQRLLRSRNDRIVLDTMKYLTDRRDGKAVQAITADVDVGSRVAELLREARKRAANFEAQDRQKEPSTSGGV